MNWFDQPQGLFKLWAESQKSLLQALAEGQIKPPPTGGPMTSPVAGFEQGIRYLNDLWKTSMAAWTALAQQGFAETGSGAFDPDRLNKLFNPAEWAQAGVGTSTFDLALEHLTEGPTYAILWDLDRKILNAQKLWLQRSKDTAACYAVVQAAWGKVFDRFAKEFNNPAGAPIKSGRDLIDLWIKTANDALLEMHRSEEFLEAQRRMTRSATEYRLQEREIAEAFCAMYHIPTRTEVDEVQRMVWEMRRELRALRRELDTARAEPKAALAKPRVAKPAAAALTDQP